MLFRLGNFYCFIFKFTDAFFCLLYCAVETIHWALKFQLLYIFSCRISSWFFFIASISLPRPFILCFKCVCNYLLHYIFIMAAWKLLSDNSNLFVMLVLAFIDHLFQSSSDFPSSWYDVCVCFFFFLHPRYFGYYVMRLWILYKTCVLADLLWQNAARGKGVPLFTAMYGWKSRFPTLLHLTPWGRRTSLFMGGGGFQFSCVVSLTLGVGVASLLLNGGENSGFLLGSFWPSSDTARRGAVWIHYCQVRMELLGLYLVFTDVISAWERVRCHIEAGKG